MATTHSSARRSSQPWRQKRLDDHESSLIWQGATTQGSSPRSMESTSNQLGNTSQLMQSSTMPNFPSNSDGHAPDEHSTKSGAGGRRGSHKLPTFASPRGAAAASVEAPQLRSLREGHVSEAVADDLFPSMSAATGHRSKVCPQCKARLVDAHVDEQTNTQSPTGAKFHGGVVPSTRKTPKPRTVCSGVQTHGGPLHTSISVQTGYDPYADGTAPSSLLTVGRSKDLSTSSADHHHGVVIKSQPVVIGGSQTMLDRAPSMTSPSKQSPHKQQHEAIHQMTAELPEPLTASSYPTVEGTHSMSIVSTQPPAHHQAAFRAQHMNSRSSSRGSQRSTSRQQQKRTTSPLAAHLIQQLQPVQVSYPVLHLGDAGIRPKPRGVPPPTTVFSSTESEASRVASLQTELYRKEEERKQQLDALHLAAQDAQNALCIDFNEALKQQAAMFEEKLYELQLEVATERQRNEQLSLMMCTPINTVHNDSRGKAGGDGAGERRNSFGPPHPDDEQSSSSGYESLHEEQLHSSRGNRTFTPATTPTSTKLSPATPPAKHMRRRRGDKDSKALPRPTGIEISTQAPELPEESTIEREDLKEALRSLFARKDDIVELMHAHTQLREVMRHSDEARDLLRHGKIPIPPPKMKILKKNNAHHQAVHAQQHQPIPGVTSMSPHQQFQLHAMKQQQQQKQAKHLKSLQQALPSGATGTALASHSSNSGLVSSAGGGSSTARSRGDVVSATPSNTPLTARESSVASQHFSGAPPSHIATNPSLSSPTPPSTAPTNIKRRTQTSTTNAATTTKRAYPHPTPRIVPTLVEEQPERETSVIVTGDESRGGPDPRMPLLTHSPITLSSEGGVVRATFGGAKTVVKSSTASTSMLPAVNVVDTTATRSSWLSSKATHDKQRPPQLSLSQSSGGKSQLSPQAERKRQQLHRSLSVSRDSAPDAW